MGTSIPFVWVLPEFVMELTSVTLKWLRYEPVKQYLQTAVGLHVKAMLWLVTMLLYQWFT